MAVRIGFPLAVLCLAGSLALAQAPADGPGFGEHRAPMERAMGHLGRSGRWWNDASMVEKLKLTDDQRKAMDQVMLEHRMQLIDLRAAVEKAEVEIEPMLREDQPNESQVMAQIDKLAQARAELEKANARFLFALRAKLSPEQWKSLRALREERREMREQRREMRGAPGARRHAPGGAPEGSPAGPPPPDGAGGPGMQSRLDLDSVPVGPDVPENGTPDLN